jgi:uncharacterized protein with HEPN domain
MIEMAEAMARLTMGRHRADPDTDEALDFALVRVLEIFGEAAARIDPDVHSRAPVIPWRKIIGTRHRLAHAYHEIDADLVWQAATRDVPLLLPTLRRLLDDA